MAGVAVLVAGVAAALVAGAGDTLGGLAVWLGLGGAVILVAEGVRGGIAGFAVVGRLGGSTVPGGRAGGGLDGILTGRLGASAGSGLGCDAVEVG